MSQPMYSVGDMVQIHLPPAGPNVDLNRLDELVEVLEIHQDDDNDKEFSYKVKSSDDRFDAHKNEDGELWVNEFEIMFGTEPES